tara:strand:+ start:14289 stop:14636 length:348 start_codon:yes stop_codon:yes gene_type:complete
MSVKRELTLSQSSLINQIQKSGKKIRSDFLTIALVSSHSPAIACLIPKKFILRANKRNLIKRIILNHYRQLYITQLGSTHLVVRVSRRPSNFSREYLNQTVAQIFDKLVDTAKRK